jgi:hypothetical protein
MSSDRFGQLRSSGPGYETTGRNNFDYRVQIEFKYDNIDAKATSVKRELKQLGNDINNLMGNIGKPSKNGTIYITKKQSKKFATGDDLFHSFDLIPDGNRIADALKPGAQEIGRTGKQIMTKYINRIDTGRMIGSVGYNTRATKNKYVINIGWVNLWYKYFGFQENGTTRGITPMRSTLRTYLELMPRTQNYLLRFMNSYTRKNAGPNAGKSVKF